MLPNPPGAAARAAARRRPERPVMRKRPRAHLFERGRASAFA
jgi:hypothetical protein